MSKGKKEQLNGVYSLSGTGFSRDPSGEEADHLIKPSEKKLFMVNSFLFITLIFPLLKKMHSWVERTLIFLKYHLLHVIPLETLKVPPCFL